MDIALYALAACLIAAGLFGSVAPALPGIPLAFAGIWLAASADHFRHVGLGWLLVIAAIGALGLALDLLAGALGAKRAGASARAVWGSLAGSLIGIFFGLPGLLLGPFVGAVAGELSSGKSIQRSAHVGIGTWVGLIFGTIMKLVACLTMILVFGAAWWFNRLVSG